MYGHYPLAIAGPTHFTAPFRLTTLCLMEGNERSVSKRQLGILLALIGTIGFVAILAIDVLDAGRPGGIGPKQALALAFMATTALVGLTLIPLGDAPA